MKDYVVGKVVIITGAGSGIGRAVAKQLAARKAKLVVSDIQETRLDAVCAELRAAGGEVVGMVADAASQADTRALVQCAVDRFGRLDVFIPNAGTMPLAPFSAHAKAVDAWARCIDINLKGAVYAIDAAYDQMIAQGGGQFIFSSSIYSSYPVLGGAVYQATKKGLEYISDGLRQESFGKLKTTVVQISGLADTNLGESIMDADGAWGLFGCQVDEWKRRLQESADGTVPPECSDPDNIQNRFCTSDYTADAFVYAIDQPMGMQISYITPRGTNEPYLL